MSVHETVPHNCVVFCVLRARERNTIIIVKLFMRAQLLSLDLCSLLYRSAPASRYWMLMKYHNTYYHQYGGSHVVGSSPPEAGMFACGVHCNHLYTPHNLCLLSALLLYVFRPVCSPFKRWVTLSEVGNTTNSCRWPACWPRGWVREGYVPPPAKGGRFCAPLVLEGIISIICNSYNNL